MPGVRAQPCLSASRTNFGPTADAGVLPPPAPAGPASWPQAVPGPCSAAAPTMAGLALSMQARQGPVMRDTANLGPLARAQGEGEARPSILASLARPGTLPGDAPRPAERQRAQIPAPSGVRDPVRIWAGLRKRPTDVPPPRLPATRLPAGAPALATATYRLPMPVSTRPPAPSDVRGRSVRGRDAMSPPSVLWECRIDACPRHCAAGDVCECPAAARCVASAVYSCTSNG